MRSAHLVIVTGTALAACNQQKTYEPPKPGEPAALVTIRILHQGPAPRGAVPPGAVRVLGQPVPRASVEIDGHGLPLPFVPIGRPQVPAGRRLQALPRAARPTAAGGPGIKAPGQAPRSWASAATAAATGRPAADNPAVRREAPGRRAGAAPGAQGRAAAGNPAPGAKPAMPRASAAGRNSSSAPLVPAPQRPATGPAQPRPSVPAGQQPQPSQAAARLLAIQGIHAWTRVRPGWHRMAVTAWYEQAYQAWEQQPFRMTKVAPCLRKVCRTVTVNGRRTEQCRNEWQQCSKTATSTRTVLATRAAAFGTCRAEGQFAFDPGRAYVLTYATDGRGRCAVACHEQVPVGRGRFLFRPCPRAPVRPGAWQRAAMAPPRPAR